MTTIQGLQSSSNAAHRTQIVLGAALLSVLLAASGLAGAQTTTIYSADMSANPGWAFTGNWAYGAGASPDPTAAHSAPNTWVGYKLGGTYESGMAEQFATTPTINCTGYTGVTLSFWRYLGVRSSGMGTDHAYVRVSNDNGATWTNVWANTAGVADSAWTSFSYSLSAVADNQPNVQVRWVMGTSVSGGMSKLCGWNVDDVLVTGTVMGPAVSAVAVESALTVLVTFNGAMGTGVTDAANYTVSGSGQGTLAASPDSVVLAGGNQYRLTWSAGEMRQGGDITITVANIQDATGTPVGGPPANTKTHVGGGIGVLPACTVTGPASPTNAASLDFLITFDDTVTGLSGTGITVTNGTKGSLTGSSAGPYTLTVTPAADGAVTCRVSAGAAQDAVGNGNSVSNLCSVVSDRTGPNPPNVDSTAPATTDPTPTWTWTSGGNGGVGTFQYALDGAGWSADTTDLSFTAPALAEGPHTLQVREADALGNWSAPGGFALNLDLTPPTGSVVIDGGATYSRFTDAALALLAEDGPGSGVAQMQFSNDGAAWSGWEAFAAAKVWTHSAGDGPKTVHVQLRDAAGNVSTEEITDSITLDTAPPTGAVVINGGADFCVTTSVGLALVSEDGSGSGAAQMQFSNDGSSWSGWEPLDTGKAWMLAIGDELKTVHVQFRDEAGNVSAAGITDTITLDTAPPTGTMVINGGGDFCSTPDVTLALTSEDGPGSGVAQMQFSDDGSTWSGWETAAAAKNWALPSGDGLKTVYVQFKDVLGLVSTMAISDEITLDSTPPTGTIAIEGGALFCNTTSVTLALTSEDGPGSGVAQMQFSNDSSTWSGWEDVAESKAWTLLTGNGLKTVRAQFRDTAGNVSTGTISDTITLDPTALTAEMQPVTPTETCRDQVALSVVFNKTVTPTFVPGAVSVEGLAGRLPSRELTRRTP